MRDTEFNRFIFLNGFVSTKYFIEENKHAAIVFINAKIIFAMMNCMQARGIQEEREFIPVLTVFGVRKTLVDGIDRDACRHHQWVKAHRSHPRPQ